jgi:hypothetical protein
MYIRLHVKYRYCCQILMKLNFIDKFLKDPQISNFMKILQVRSPVITSGQTDRHDEAITRV